VCVCVYCLYCFFF